MSDQRSRRSFIDESHRASLGGGTYLFGVITVSPDHEQPVRDRLRGALAGKLTRLHWRRDRTEYRLRGIEALALAEVEGVTIYRGDVRGRQERARQDALWSVAYDRREHDVLDLVFEARERSLNQRDESTLASIQRTLPELRYTFARPRDEPLLWAADYLLGAVGQWLEHDDDRYISLLPDRLLRLKPIAPHT